jgi:toxin-antitoxin system PIN domain toxin
VILCDVNVLVYASREDTPRHAAYRDWLEEQLDADSAFGVSPLVLSGFLRVVTNRRAMKTPTPLDTALRFCDQLTAAPQAVLVQPGQRSATFARLVEEPAHVVGSGFWRFAEARAAGYWCVLAPSSSERR